MYIAHVRGDLDINELLNPYATPCPVTARPAAATRVSFHCDRVQEIETAGRKRNPKKARAVQPESPSKNTGGIRKKTNYKSKQKRLRSMYNRLHRAGQM